MSGKELDQKTSREAVSHMLASIDKAAENAIFLKKLFEQNGEKDAIARFLDWLNQSTSDFGVDREWLIGQLKLYYENNTFKIDLQNELDYSLQKNIRLEQKLLVEAEKLNWLEAHHYAQGKSLEREIEELKKYSWKPWPLPSKLELAEEAIYFLKIGSPLKAEYRQVAGYFMEEDDKLLFLLVNSYCEDRGVYEHLLIDPNKYSIVNSVIQESIISWMGPLYHNKTIKHFP